MLSIKFLSEDETEY